MIFSADLHLHSHYSRAVSPQMTVENIAEWARRKGVDIIGTGDCLQPAWLDELQGKLVETEPGLFSPGPKFEQTAEAYFSDRPLRFVLSTEVHCAPAGTPELGGLHHLMYFRSFASARRMQQRLEKYGDLNEGRPRLNLTSRQLLRAVKTHQEGCQFAPAHVWNPFFSSFGSQSGGASLEEIFRDAAPDLTLAETGLTSTPLMCRRFSPLDSCTLFSCSDAHSLENIGREYTRVEIEPSYDALFAALHGRGPGRVVDTIKFPIERTRYYRNRCVRCQASFDGKQCPRCGSDLIMGSRDRLEIIADRRDPKIDSEAPPFRMLLPLRYVIGEVCQCPHDSKAVEPHYRRLLKEVGNERYILTEASEREIAEASTIQLARAICWQRNNPPGRSALDGTKHPDDQPSLFDVDEILPEMNAGKRISADEVRRNYADQLGNE